MADLSDRPPWCDRCGVRYARQWVRQLDEGHGTPVRALCERCFGEGGSQSEPVLARGTIDEAFDDEVDEKVSAQRSSGVEVPIHQPIHQTDVTASFSDATRRVLHNAAYISVADGSSDVDTNHLLRAVLDEPVGQELFDQMGGDRDWVCAQIDPDESQPPSGVEAPRLTPDSKRVLLAAFEESLLADTSYVGPEHLLVALAIDADSSAGVLLRHIDGSPSAIRQLLPRNARSREPAPDRSPTPMIDAYSVDLTQAAREGRLDPVVGRSVEIDQTIEVLSRRLKNNPLLIGDPGVGKTAIIEAIAQRIVSKDIPAHLAGRRIVTLELEQMVAGARLRGEFEERLTGVVSEAIANPDEILLFIDEFHTAIGAGGGEGAMAAAEILKPRLGRGELQLVGATTLDEYRRHVERDVALSRRFQPVVVPEPPVMETIQILLGLRDRYEVYHRVRITDEALTAAAEMSSRYIPDRALPDKAVDLIDQASARVRLRPPSNDVAELEGELEGLLRNLHQTQGWNHHHEGSQELEARIKQVREELKERRGLPHQTRSVTAQDVAEVVGRATGIPVARISQTESERLLQLEEQLGRRVVGQDEAVRKVAEAVRRNRAGLSDPERPTGSFLFLGPTGVGKTELAKSLATALIGDDNSLVRFDMSEFQERHSVARLIGAPPGYVGFEDSGQLTEQLRRRPYSVLLLDEIEKAHPDISNVLLQLLDDGRITDAHGRTIDARNCVVVMTSNVGLSRQGRSGPTGFVKAGGRSAVEHTESVILDALRREFSPEFLNRIDDTVVFRPLGIEELRTITSMLLEDLRSRLAGQDITLEMTDAAIDLLASQGFDPDNGARPLRRLIDRTLSSELSRMLLGGQLTGGTTAQVDVEGDELKVTTQPRSGEESDRLIELPEEQVAVGRIASWEEPGGGRGEPPVQPRR